MEFLTTSHPSSKLFKAFVLGSALAVAAATGGCTQERDQLRVEKARLTEENRQLAENLKSRESESTEANATLADVQKGLESIRAQELKVLHASLDVAQEGKTATAGTRERLEAELKTIREAVRQNLAKLARFEKSNKENGTQIASLQKLADELKRSLEEKDVTLAALDKKVEELNATVESQKTSLAERDVTIHEGETKMAQTTKELHTAYVAVGSKDALKKKGVVERRGDVAGLGGRWIETGKFDPDVFREVDVTKDLEVEIPAPAKNVRVVTAQPKESYAIVSGGPNAKTSRLEVKDPAAFWKGDRYLVVMTD
jgi:chromosome segregation ATPase